ncbi:MAG: ATP-binding protein [Acidobacteriia bacterium]|nr:ATP-binding protein [Terriglobia bacterium]
MTRNGEPFDAKLLLQDESQVFERKQSLSLQREGLESLCGMVNADPARGTIAFGLAPNGQVVGVEPGVLDKAQRTLTQVIRNRIDPPIQCTIDVREVEGKHVLILSARRSRDVPYHEFGGRAFIREGTSTRQLSLAEKQSLQRMRSRDIHPGPWTCDKCRSMVGVLGSFVITNEGMRRTYACECGGEFWPAT